MSKIDNLKNIDYSNFPITKLPPGKAKGADDLKKWGWKAASAKAGGVAPKILHATLVCTACGHQQVVKVAKHKTAKKFLHNFHGECQKCGGKNKIDGFRHTPKIGARR